MSCEWTLVRTGGYGIVNYWHHSHGLQISTAVLHLHSTFIPRTCHGGLMFTVLDHPNSGISSSIPSRDIDVLARFFHFEGWGLRFSVIETWLHWNSGLVFYISSRPYILIFLGVRRLHLVPPPPPPQNNTPVPRTYLFWGGTLKLLLLHWAQEARN